MNTVPHRHGMTMLIMTVMTFWVLIYTKVLKIFSEIKIYSSIFAYDSSSGS